MATGDEVTLRIVGRYQDQNVVNTVHYRIVTQDATDAEILQKMCDVWDSNVKASWLAAHSASYTLVGLKAFGKTGSGKIPGFKAIGTAGGVTGDGAPAFACRTITLYTDDANHRKRGRLMLSGSPVAHFDATDGSLTSAAIALLDAIGAFMDDEIDDNLNYFRAGLPATATSVFKEFTGYKSRETPSSVTSRRIRQFLIG